MRTRLILAILFMAGSGALLAQNPNADSTVVVGNPAQPVQWVHKESISAAIKHAGPNGTVIIPSSYTGTDCIPVSVCNLSGTTIVLDWRTNASGGGTTNPLASTGPFTVGISNPPGVSAILFNGPDAFGLCNSLQFDQLTDLSDPATGSSSLAWNPNCLVNQRVFTTAFQTGAYAEGNIWAFNVNQGMPQVVQGLTINSATGTAVGTEGATQSGIATKDILWPDLVAHRWKINNNNAGALNIAGVATPGTSAHLAIFAANGIDLIDGGALSGGGTTISGTPANQQLALWVSGTAVQGLPTLTYDGTTFTTTGTGGMTAPKFNAVGVGAGLNSLTQGSDNSGNCPVNSVCDQAAAIVTKYTNTRPASAAQGTVSGTVSGSVVTQSFSGDTGHSATITVGSGASIGSTSLCSTALCPAGAYRVNSYLDITTPCATSGTYSVSLIWTDDQGSKTVVIPMLGTGESAGVLTTTSTANFGQASTILRSTGSASINYLTTAVACGSAGPMVGKLYLSVENVQ